MKYNSLVKCVRSFFLSFFPSFFLLYLSFVHLCVRSFAIGWFVRPRQYKSDLFMPYSFVKNTLFLPFLLLPSYRSFIYFGLCPSAPVNVGPILCPTRSLKTHFLSFFNRSFIYLCVRIFAVVLVVLSIRTVHVGPFF